MFVDRIIEPVLGLPRAVKRIIVMGVDAGLCLLSVWFALYLRLGEWIYLSGDVWPAAAVSFIALPIFASLGLYRAVFRYVSWTALVAIAQAVMIYGIIYSSLFTAFGVDGVPRTVGIIQPILLFIAVAASRAFGRYWLGGGLRQRMRGRQRRNVLIYGAGLAGQQLASALADSLDSKLAGFIDDARNLHGSSLGGVRVWAPEKLTELVEQLDIAEVYLAIPSAGRRRRNEILQAIRAAGVAVRTLPGLLDIAHGKVTVSDLRPLEVEDLLGRDAVALDEVPLQCSIYAKVVLVTGAGGSIGSELCRQILTFRPAILLLVDCSEYALYDIHRELERLEPEPDRAETKLVPLLASVCDEGRMRSIFAAWRPDAVYHAAAYKHVPLVEHNAVEGVRNNVLGTMICATLAHTHGAENFVLISTDKAVRPTNVMGASKRLAEMALQALAGSESATCFSMVRFGNVLGSSGSVVPLFRQQIATGGPVTVTDPDIIRYFMTIPEAAQLVIQAGSMAKGGEVFVLDMGEPVKILDLAHRMIELSGFTVRDELNPDGDIEVAFTGLRPGEKLYEELLIGNNPSRTAHPRVMMASEPFPPMPRLRTMLERLSAAIENHDVAELRERLSESVAEYVPAADMVDWIFVRMQEAAGEVRAAPAPKTAIAGRPD